MRSFGGDCGEVHRQRFKQFNGNDERFPRLVEQGSVIGYIFPLNRLIWQSFPEMISAGREKGNNAN